jgi:hypothetical protein
MTLQLQQTVSAVGIGTPVNFQAVGGTAPYVYSVVPGGAGGTINATSGNYTTPTQVNFSPGKAFDTILVTDAAAATATAKILVTTPLGLLCDILQTELGLANGRVYFWDQKIFQPTDAGLYIAVSVASSKPFANTWGQSRHGIEGDQYVSMYDLIDIDIISRDMSAFYRRTEVLFAISSFYSEQQQEFNSFSIGRLPPGARFINLSDLDGAAIPYRFRISVAMQYAMARTKAIEYFDNGFFPVEVDVDTGQVEIIDLLTQAGDEIETESGINILVTGF